MAFPTDTPASPELAEHFRRFATQESSNQPLNRAICEAVAASPALLQLCQLMPPRQARANLLLAAVHERLLAGCQHPLRDYYPNLGGHRAPDAALPGMLEDFVAQQRHAIAALLRDGATQTNETGRCGPLRLALDEIGSERYALFDFGCSAGLNLGVDEDALSVAGQRRGPGSRLQLQLDWRGGRLPPARDWRIVERLGVDLAPIQADDEVGRRWLQACVWPNDAQRFERLRLALDWAQRARPPLRQSRQGLEELAAWLPSLPAAVQPVLINSWVLCYLNADERADFHAQALRLVQERGVVWICAEPVEAQPLPAPQPPPDAQGATLWSLHSRDQGSRAWAWSHAHGLWAQALD